VWYWPSPSPGTYNSVGDAYHKRKWQAVTSHDVRIIDLPLIEKCWVPLSHEKRQIWKPYGTTIAGVGRLCGSEILELRERREISSRKSFKTRHPLKSFAALSGSRLAELPFLILVLSMYICYLFNKVLKTYQISNLNIMMRLNKKKKIKWNIKKKKKKKI
jgi:hypothetical protein